MQKLVSGIRYYFKTYINVRMGLLSGIFLGAVVAYINREYGFFPALIAGLKQGAYTFLFGGSIIKLCEYLATRYESSIKSWLLGALIPTAITLSAILIVHHLRGTPRPLASVLPTLLLAPPGFIYLAWNFRRKLGKRSSLS